MEIKPITNKRKIVIFKSDLNLDKRNFKDWSDMILNNSIIFLPSWISYEVVEVDDLRFVLSSEHPENDKFDRAKLLYVDRDSSEFLQKFKEFLNEDDGK